MNITINSREEISFIADSFSPFVETRGIRKLILDFSKELKKEDSEFKFFAFGREILGKNINYKIEVFRPDGGSMGFVDLGKFYNKKEAKRVSKHMNTHFPNHKYILVQAGRKNS